MAYFVQHATRLSDLLGAWLDATEAPPSSSVFQAETVIVPGPGMERYLALGLADRRGICCNVDFLYPERWLRQLLSLGSDRPFPFDRNRMIWLVKRALPDLLGDPDFAPLARYLSRDDGVRSYRLAEKIATLYDSYAIHRIDWLEAWMEGQPIDVTESLQSQAAWQAKLFRRLVEWNPDFDIVGRLRILESELASAESELPLPERITVFGISYVANLYLRLLEQLSARVDVRLFVLRASHPGDANDLGLAMGQASRDFFSIVADAPLATEDCTPPVKTEQSDTLLKRIQEDVRSGSNPRAVVNLPPDDSIVFSSSASALRELEALHDWLLLRFKEDPTLQANEIIVVTPDIARYAPLVDAVFGNPETEDHRIEYSIADASSAAERVWTQAFFGALDLLRSRVTAPEVLALLELPVIRERFQLTDRDLDVLREWVRLNQIRWGVDQEHLNELDLPISDRHAWSQGLDRLLLAYFIPPTHARVFHDLLPTTDIAADETRLPGILADVLALLREYRARFREHRTLLEWAAELSAFTERIFPSAASSETLERLHELRELALQTRFEDRVELAVIREFLERRLLRSRSGSGFLAGRVTFCAMLPMRALPFRILCVLGMNESVFPASERLPGFYLHTRQPRPGDRIRTKEDRLLFLETLLAAEEHLYLSYVGQSARSGRSRRPSIVLFELQEYIRRYYRMEGGPQHYSHRLQAFHPDYFRRDSELFSFSSRNAIAARGVWRTDFVDTSFATVEDFAPAETPRPTEDCDSMRLALTSFRRLLRSPIALWVEERVGIDLQRGTTNSEIEEAEPFLPTRLDAFLMRSEAIDYLLESGHPDPGEIKSRWRASGRLPGGAAGDIVCEEWYNGAARFVARLHTLVGRKLPNDAERPSLAINDRHEVTSAGEHLFERGQALFRPGKIRAADLVYAWICHLFLCAREEPQKTFVLGAEDGWCFPDPIDPLEARQQLEGWLASYTLAMRKIILFFPRASYEYVRTREEKGRDGPAVNAAKRVWETQYLTEGEGDSTLHKLVLRGQPWYDATHPFAFDSPVRETAVFFAENWILPAWRARRPLQTGAGFRE